MSKYEQHIMSSEQHLANMSNTQQAVSCTQQTRATYYNKEWKIQNIDHTGPIKQHVQQWAHIVDQHSNIKHIKQRIQQWTRRATHKYQTYRATHNNEHVDQHTKHIATVSNIKQTRTTQMSSILSSTYNNERKILRT